ncbi:MAG TPA: GNAT family N-acetyltransferase [Cyanobacteria bacterium UBA8803]|nr:GNAT family N-acetyltransferase [Cyanobacteria bacterium UBA9273]HBL57900.1 GNAT family N-acetyltransferase [Cyanobacteria bacterium UBA8803]
MHYLYNTIVFYQNVLVIVNPCFSGFTSYQLPTGQVAIDISHLNIRTAQDRDLTTLAEILTDSFHPHQGIWRWAYPILRLGIYEDLRNRLRVNSPHYACLVAVTDGSGVGGANEQLVGTVELTLRSTHSWQPHSLQYPYISNLAVRTSCRRQGVARQLLLACETKSLEWGFPEIYLHVLENNHQARQLYLKTGYRLHQVDPSCSAWLLRRPKRLFLHKPLKL